MGCLLSAKAPPSLRGHLWKLLLLCSSQSVGTKESLARSSLHRRGRGDSSECRARGLEGWHWLQDKDGEGRAEEGLTGSQDSVSGGSHTHGCPWLGNRGSTCVLD